MTSDGATIYSYDLENRLVSAAGGRTMSYDPNGRLYQTAGEASGTTRFLYDGDALVGEYNASGAMLRRYVHGSGVDEPLVQYNGAALGAGNRNYLHADHLGSIVAITNGAGVTQEVDTYSEYGVPATGNRSRFQYTGQISLPDLGMYYYKARIYNPALGRFMQTDPIGYKDDINLYAYVGGNPMNARDPDGQSAELLWTAPGKVTYTVRWTRTGVSPAFRAADVNAQIKKDFSGTVNLGGTSVQITARGVFVPVPDARPVNTVNVVNDTAGVTATGTAETNSIGGNRVTVGATGVQAGTANTMSHELGGHVGGAGDQYAGGVGANGVRLTASVPGPNNVMRELSGQPANAQSLREILRAPTNTNKCATGVTAANGGC